MSHARPDSTTVSAASAGPRARTAPPPPPPPPERSGEPRRIGVDAGAAPGPGSRRQIVLVASVLDPPRPEEVAARETSGDVLGHAVVDVHEVSEAFGGETIAVLGHQVVAAFPYDHAADAVSAAVEIQRDAARSAAAGHEWSCTVCVVAGEVVDDPVFERIGVQPVGAVVSRALQLSRSTSPGSVVTDELTALPAAGPAGDGGAAAPPPPAETDSSEGAVVSTTPPWTLGEIVFDANTATRSARVAVSTSAGNRSGTRGQRGAPANRRGRSQPARRESRPVTSQSLRRRPWSEGRVFCWFSDRGRGVITSTTGQEFYVDRRFLAVGSELSAGDRVYFVPRDPVARGRNPVAGSVLADGARLEVRIERASDEGAALAVVSDSNGTDQVLPLDTASVGPVTTGEWLLVKVAGREGGPVGRPVQ
jgi:hypothetical protein